MRHRKLFRMQNTVMCERKHIFIMPNFRRSSSTFAIPFINTALPADARTYLCWYLCVCFIPCPTPHTPYTQRLYMIWQKGITFERIWRQRTKRKRNVSEYISRTAESRKRDSADIFTVYLFLVKTAGSSGIIGRKYLLICMKRSNILSMQMPGSNSNVW